MYHVKVFGGICDIVNIYIFYATIKVYATILITRIQELQEDTTLAEIP